MKVILCPIGANSQCGNICPKDTLDITYICPQYLDEVSFSNIQEWVEEPYIRLGFKEQWEQNELRKIIDELGKLKRANYVSNLIEYFEDSKIIRTIAEIGLFGEEQGELLEAVRKGFPLTTKKKVKGETTIGEECADLAIRLMNLCNRMGISLVWEIMKKHSYNVDREYLHGKKA